MWCHTDRWDASICSVLCFILCRSLYLSFSLCFLLPSSVFCLLIVLNIVCFCASAFLYIRPCINRHWQVYHGWPGWCACGFSGSPQSRLSELWLYLNLSICTITNKYDYLTYWLIVTTNVSEVVLHHIMSVNSEVNAKQHPSHSCDHWPAMKMFYSQCSSSSSLFSMHHQCVAPLAANSLHSGLFRASSIASSKVRLCRARSFFRVAIQEV